MDFITSFDHAFFRLINQAWSNEVFDVFFPFVTDLHKTLPFKILLIASLLALHITKLKKKGIFLTLYCLVTMALTDLTGNELFKKTFNRSRPFEITELQTQQRSPAKAGSGFISNHSANMFSLATLNALVLPATAPYFFPIAAIIAYSRVYNGVHFPSDVLGGAVWGSFIAFLMYLLWSRFLISKLGPKKETP